MSKVLFKNFDAVNSNFTEILKKQAMLVNENGLIEWIGNQSQLTQYLKDQAQFAGAEKKTSKKSKTQIKEIDLKKKLIFPSFIECHTHSVFAGSRAQEFEMRLQGKSYSEIAKAGGGILSTMRNTRQASLNQLQESTDVRIQNFLKQGVSTLEIKSGYALDLKNEIKVLQAIQKLQKKYQAANSINIISTFLGAHAKPPEFDSYEKYLTFLADTVLPEVKKKKLSNRVDIFIEKGFFEGRAAQDYIHHARQMGFQTTIHANQITMSGGVEVAIAEQALSADHVIQMNDQLIAKLAKSKTVAVLLPAADLYMQCDYPQARKMLDAGVTVALATDFNPGTCPTQDLSLVGLLARLEMKMTLPEVFVAYTSGAAQALGISEIEGRLLPGMRANFISTEASLTDFFYSAGNTPRHQLFIRGKLIY